MSFKEEAEELGANQESGEWTMNVEENEGETMKVLSRKRIEMNQSRMKCRSRWDKTRP